MTMGELKKWLEQRGWTIRQLTREEERERDSNASHLVTDGFYNKMYFAFPRDDGHRLMSACCELVMKVVSDLVPNVEDKALE